MLKDKKPIFCAFTIAALACLVAAICLLSPPKAENSASYMRPSAAPLFAYRTAYVGDNAAVGNIVSLLAFPSDVQYDHIELQTSAAPYALFLYFSVTPQVKAAYRTSEPDDADLFRENACVLFSLIENVDEITFRLDDGAESPVDLPFTREWAENIVGADLWAESSSAEKLDDLITQIHAHVKSAATSAAEGLSTGPFAGYVRATNAGAFDVCTQDHGTYLMSLPMSLLDGFPANQREPGWMGLHVYCGSMDAFTWAVVCTDASAGDGSGNVCTSSDGGKTWWVGDGSAMYAGTVTGAGFASAKVGFISYRCHVDQGPEISRTLDGGKTWSRMAVDVPDPLKAYKMTPLVPTFTGNSGIYPITLYDDNSNVSTAYLTTKDGGMTWQWKGGTLDEAISSALLQEGQTRYLSGECAVEGHILLGQEEQSGITTVYALTMYGEYGFEDGNFVKVSGSGAIPAVFTFTGSGDDFVCTEIEYPSDGSDYEKSIQKMFPSEYQSKVLSPSDNDVQNLKVQERAYAASYLKKIGREAVIGDYGDFEHPLLTDMGISVDVSNSILGNSVFANYPMWIGSREVLENGVRYVYQESYDEAAHEIVFTKYEYATKAVAALIRMDSLRF